MHLRSEKELLLEDEYLFDNIEEENAEFIPHDYLNDKQRRLEVLNAVNNLPTEQRVSIVMYYFKELPTREIAQILSISEETVRKRLSRARMNMRKALDFIFV